MNSSRVRQNPIAVLMNTQHSCIQIHKAAYRVSKFKQHRAETSSDEKEEDDSSNTLMILGIAAIGIVFILFGSIAVLLRKKPSSRAKSDIGAVHPALEDGSSFDDKDESEKSAYELMQATKSQKSVMNLFLLGKNYPMASGYLMMKMGSTGIKIRMEGTGIQPMMDLRFGMNETIKCLLIVKRI